MYVVDLPIHDLPVPKADRRAPVGPLPPDWQIQSIFSHNIFSNVYDIKFWATGKSTKIKVDMKG